VAKCVEHRLVDENPTGKHQIFDHGRIRRTGGCRRGLRFNLKGQRGIALRIKTTVANALFMARLTLSVLDLALKYRGTRALPQSRHAKTKFRPFRRPYTNKSGPYWSTWFAHRRGLSCSRTSQLCLH
jgi:hypothetical protein